MSVYGGPDIITDGLVLHLDAANRKSYPLTGSTIYDLSGNSSNATLGSSTQAPTHSTNNNGYFSFDGSNDYVLIDNTVTRTVCTHEIIFYPTSLTGGANGWSTLMFFQTSEARSFYFELKSDGSIGVSYPNSTYTSDIHQFSNSGTISINNWYHAFLIVNKPSNAIKIYLNNTLVKSVSPGTHTATFGGYIYMGMQGSDSANAYARKFAGKIALARAYNKELSANEVQQNYNALKGRYGLT